MRRACVVQRLAVWLCLCLVLLAAVTPTAASLPLAILFIFWFFVAKVLIALLPHVDDQSDLLYALALPAFSPRPPPARS
jgi:hypothetical protein